MNEFIKMMEERRSIRKFNPEMPPKADLDQIVEAGLYAPSAKNSQPTLTLVVTNKEPTRIAESAAGTRTLTHSTARPRFLSCLPKRTGQTASMTAALLWGI